MYRERYEKKGQYNLCKKSMLREKGLYQLKHISKSVGLSSDSDILSNYQFLNMVKFQMVPGIRTSQKRGKKNRLRERREIKKKI